MNPGPRVERHRRLVVLAVAVTGITAALLAAVRLRTPAPPAQRPPQGNIVYIDVEGWYGRSAVEVAARTPYTFTIEGLPSGLPLSIGTWQGQDRPHDPAVDVWLKSPEVSVERTYRRPDGGLVWLSIFGSRGAKSYHLFEHTPESCYPLGGWQIDRFEVVKLRLGPRPLPANFGLAHKGSQRLVFAHLYIWDSPSRDPARGVVSLRVAAPVRSAPEDATAALLSGFVAELFPNTLPWRRF